MKHKKIIYISIVVIIGAFTMYKFIDNLYQSSKQSFSSNKSDSSPSVKNTLSTQTSQGDVTVEVTPKTLAVGSTALFDIRFTTHSGNINYDLVAIASLNDDLGMSYKAVSWNGNMGGHHVEGILTFSPIAKSAKKVTLSIPNINNKDRVFTWEL